MKICVLFFFAAVWMQMPSASGAKHFAQALKAASPVKRSFSPAMLADITKRHNAEVKKRGASSEEDNRSLREFLESDEVRELLEANGITMKELNELVDNDDDIPVEHKDLMKSILVLTLAGADMSSLAGLFTGIEDRSVFKQK